MNAALNNQIDINEINEVDVRTLQEHYPEQFERAYQNWCEHSLHYDDISCHWTHDEAERMCAEYGFEYKPYSLNWTGFWSQGDGASIEFELDSRNIDKFLSHQPIRDAIIADAGLFACVEAVRIGALNVCVARSGNSHYCHEMTMGVDYEEDIGDGGWIVDGGVFVGMPFEEMYKIYEPSIGDFGQWILEIGRDIARDMYSQLRDEYEYVTSVESFIEWAESMGEKFEVE